MGRCWALPSRRPQWPGRNRPFDPVGGWTLIPPPQRGARHVIDFHAALENNTLHDTVLLTTTGVVFFCRRYLPCHYTCPDVIGATTVVEPWLGPTTTVVG